MTSTQVSHHVGQLGLDRGDRDGVDDVAHGRPAGQVVDRLAQPLQHRADRDRVGRPLHRLVGVVAGVEVGEDEHGRPPGDRGVRAASSSPRRSRWRRRTGWAPRPSRPGARSLTSAVAADTFSTSVPLPRGAGRVGQHRHPRLDAEGRRGRRRGDRDVRELLGGGVRVDRAVAVDEHLVLQAHEEHRGDDRDPRHGLHDLQRRPDGVGGGVHRARHHAVGQAELDHHRAEVGHVGDDRARLVEVDAPVLRGARGTPPRTARPAARRAG